MENCSQRLCKLCLNITDKNFVIIKDIQNVLDVLSLRLDFGRTEPRVICSVCCTKLFAAYDFKSMCIEIEDSILSYIDDEDVMQIDLKDLYLKKKGNGQQITDIFNYQVCRLCMELIDGGFMKLKDVLDQDIIPGYIPEPNLQVTKDPVICQQCLDSLKIHSDFLKICLGAERKVNISGIADNFMNEVNVKIEDNVEDELANELDIKVEETEIKLEEVDRGSLEPLADSHCGMVKIEADRNPKDVTMDKANKTEQLLYSIKNRNGLAEWRREIKKHLSCSETQMYKCDKCDYQHKTERGLLEHQMRHKDQSKLLMYQCDRCDFLTKWKSNLITHQATHKDPSKFQIYKCKKCDYRSKWKGVVIRHQLIHEKEKWKCKKRDYQTNQEINHKHHQISHENPSEIQMYKCDKCDYRSETKQRLLEHRIKHKDPSKVLMYQCDKCDFLTECEGDIKEHRVMHKDPSKIQIYKCSRCDFLSKWKIVIIRHQVKHEKETLKCEKCDYQTNQEISFMRHQVCHKNPSKAQMYRCDECNYRSNWKTNVIRHQAIHGKQVYKCEKCDYRTERKINFICHRVIHENPTNE